MFKIVMSNHGNGRARVPTARELRQDARVPGPWLAVFFNRLFTVAHVMLPLNADQIALLCAAEPEGLAARTLRAHSELRWLAHLGLLSTDDGARHRLTEAGLRRIARDPAQISACA